MTAEKINKNVMNNILAGKLDEVPELPRQSLRIYVCSNYSDFQEERTALLTDTFPSLQHYCLKYGFDVHWIDVHHGSPMDHAKDSHSFHRHLATIEECYKESAGPFFVCLLGSKYGHCPLPNSLDHSEFTHIRNEAFESGKDIRLLDEWYVKDETSSPIVYRLKPIYEVYKSIYNRSKEPFPSHDTDIESWCSTYTNLLDMIQYGAKIAHAEGHINQVHLLKQERFFTSAMETELTHAMKFNPKGCIFVFRNIEGLIKEDEECDWKSFIDLHSDRMNTVDQKKQQKLKDLKSEVDSKIHSSNKFTFTLPWKDFRCRKENSDYVHYLENMCAGIAMRITDLLEKSMQKTFSIPSSIKGELCLEALIHIHYCKRIIMDYKSSGMDNFFTDIQILLQNGSKTDHQCIIIKGDPGVGKTTFVSKLCYKIRELFGRETILIPKFANVSPRSRSMIEILRDICLQLNFVLQQNISLTTYDLSHLMKCFCDLLNHISKDGRQVVIVIDGLEKIIQNSNEDNDTFDWLTCKFPAKVHVILSYRSTCSNTVFQKLENRNQSSNSILNFPKWTHERGKTFLSSLLSEQKRTLTLNQESLALSTLCKGSIFASRTILWVTKSWNSKLLNINSSLPLSNTDIVNRHLDQLEAIFGKDFIELVFGYIACSGFGMSTSELLDLLSCNTDSFFNKDRREALRFPWFYWIFLKSQTGNLLERRFVHRRFIHCCSHDFIEEIIKRRYLNGTDLICKLNNDIVDMYLNTWLEGKPLSYFQNDIPTQECFPRLVCQQPLLYSDTKYNNRKVHQLWLHLLHSGDTDRLKKCAVCNFEYLLAMIDSSTIQNVLANFRYILSTLIDPEIFLTYNCLVKSSAVLRRYSVQLANEIIGQLKETGDLFPVTLESLVTQSMQWCDEYNNPLFIPMTSWLPVPHVPLMTSMQGGHLILPLHNHQYILCTYGLCDIAMYHVASNKLLKILSGHRGLIRALILSTNRNICISGSEDGTIRLWKYVDGICVNVIREHLGGVLCLAVTSDDKYVISGSEDTTIAVSENTTGKRVHVLSGHTKAVTSVRLNSVGDLLASASKDASIVIWCFKDMIMLTKFQYIVSPITCMELSVDNTFLVTGCADGSVHVVSFTTGTLIHQLKGHRALANAIAVSNNCYHVFVGCKDGMVYLYNFRTTELIQVFRSHNSSVHDVRLSNDQNIVFTTSESETNVWSFLPKMTNIVANSNHKCFVTCVAITEDGKLVLSGSSDGEIKIWNMETKKCVDSFVGHAGGITCIELSSNSAFAVSASEDKLLKVWSLTLRMIIATYDEHCNIVKQIRILEDDVRVLSYDILGHFKLWRADDKSTLMTYDMQTNSFILTSDNKYLITAKGDNIARIWTLEDATLLTTVKHTEKINCLCCDKENQYLVTGSADKSCKVWDLLTGKLTQVLIEHSVEVMHVLITDDNETVISSDIGRNIIVWDLKRGEYRHKLSCHRDAITTFRLLNDNFLLTSSRDCTIRLWDIGRGLHVTMIDMHSPVLNCVMSDDSCHIAVHLQADKHVPLLLLHNSPELPDTSANYTYFLENEDDEPILPIQPKLHPATDYSIVYPIPKRPERRVSAASSLPEIIKLSPIMAPKPKIAQKFRKPTVHRNFGNGNRLHNHDAKMSAFCNVL